MTIKLTRPILDNEDHLIKLLEGIENRHGKKIAGIKQKGLSLTIEFVY